MIERRSNRRARNGRKTPKNVLFVFQNCTFRFADYIWLNSQGQFRSFDCHCYEVGKKLPSNVHYYITEIATPFKEIFQEFSKRGVKIRNCFLCKFSKQDSWGERLCVLYQKHNLQRKPSPHCAASCPHYREDFEYPQNMVQIEQPLSTEQSECFQTHKFYYHICKDIL